jgi:hypothetical protein
MAKTGHEETAETSRQTNTPHQFSAGRSGGFGGREGQSARQDTQSAERNMQSAAREYMSGTLLRPYVDLLREIESSNQQWAEGVGMAVEQTLNVASKMHETFIMQMKRSSDMCLQIYHTGVSAQQSMTNNAAQGNGFRSEAAE